MVAQTPAQAVVNVSTFAGTGTAGFSGDGGAAPSAMLSQPWGVTTDEIGNVFIMDNVCSGAPSLVQNTYCEYHVVGHKRSLPWPLHYDGHCLEQDALDFLD
jgi:hypothetical protein